MKIYIFKADMKKIMAKFEKLLEKKLEIFTHSQLLIMDILQDLKNTLGQINSATNDVANDIAALIEQAAGGISAQDAAAFNAQLTEAAARLKGVASAYPAAPVPTGEIPGAELPSGGLSGETVVNAPAAELPSGGISTETPPVVEPPVADPNA